MTSAIHTFRGEHAGLQHIRVAQEEDTRFGDERVRIQFDSGAGNQTIIWLSFYEAESLRVLLSSFLDREEIA